MVKEDAMKIADTVMEALLFMLNPSLGKAGGLHEDALMAVGSLIECKGGRGGVAKRKKTRDFAD